MKIPIGDHSITLRDGPEAMIVDVGDSQIFQAATPAQ